MRLVQGLLDAEVLRDLGWVFLHLLWQGALIALLAALGLRLLERRSAQARYLVLCLALGALAAVPGLTFAVVRGVGSSSALERAAAAAGPWSAPDEDPLVRLLPAFSLFWILGSLLQQSRTLFQWGVAQRLKRRATRALPAELHALAEELRRRLGIPRAVRALESSAVRVPSVVGWWRPVVLLPAYALTRLTPAELRAVLAHELAHVRRHDYLVNLLQALLESLFFFHPAVWWLSHRLRVEREYCCDDVAVEVCGDAVGYARALERLESLRAGLAHPAPHPSLAPSTALFSHGGSLMSRIRRLLRLQPSLSGDPRAPRALFAAFATVLAAGVFSTSAHGIAPPAAPVPQSAFGGGGAGQEDLEAALERVRRELEDVTRRLEELRARDGESQPDARPRWRGLGGTYSPIPGPHSEELRLKIEDAVKRAQELHGNTVVIPRRRQADPAPMPDRYGPDADKLKQRIEESVRRALEEARAGQDQAFRQRFPGAQGVTPAVPPAPMTPELEERVRRAIEERLPRRSETRLWRHPQPEAAPEAPAPPAAPEAGADVGRRIREHVREALRAHRESGDRRAPGDAAPRVWQRFLQPGEAAPAPTPFQGVDDLERRIEEAVRRALEQHHDPLLEQHHDALLEQHRDPLLKQHHDALLELRSLRGARGAGGSAGAGGAQGAFGGGFGGGQRGALLAPSAPGERPFLVPGVALPLQPGAVLRQGVPIPGVRAPLLLLLPGQPAPAGAAGAPADCGTAPCTAPEAAAPAAPPAPVLDDGEVA